jgi:hypothetical protein
MNIFYKEKVMCSVKMYKQESDALSVPVWKSLDSLEKEIENLMALKI